MKIYKEKAGVISTYPIWVCFIDAYMYDSKTVIGLIYSILTQWKSSKNLVQ